MARGRMSEVRPAREWTADEVMTFATAPPPLPPVGGAEGFVGAGQGGGP
jgi:hypothetical protein